MKENILILSRRYSVDSQILYKEALNESWKIWRFTSRDIPDWVRDGNVAIYCEAVFAEFLAEALNIKLLSPAPDILTKLPFVFLKRQVEFLTYSQFQRPANRKFIKPADHKYFTAGIYDINDKIPGLDQLQADDPILISDVVKIINEYRVFIHDHKVIAHSIYIENGVFIGEDVQRGTENKEVLEFTTQVIDSIKDCMPSSYVVDVGQLFSGDLLVIEFNPVWASGIYGADPSAVLKCILQASKRVDASA